jgi:hypothetical protein
MVFSASQFAALAAIKPVTQVNSLLVESGGTG